MISAIILAAGESKRMGRPKMLLPWGGESVLEHVISVFQSAGLDDIWVITGGARERVEKLAFGRGVQCIHNKDFSRGEMLSSLQCGIGAVPPQTQAVLIGLGDQPQVREGSVRGVCDAFNKSGSPLVVPSYHMRRGHPWLVARPLWDGLLKLKFPQSPRDFLNEHADQIQYVDVDDPNILADLDTPQDYQKWNSSKS